MVLPNTLPWSSTRQMALQQAELASPPHFLETKPPPTTPPTRPDRRPVTPSTDPLHHYLRPSQPPRKRRHTKLRGDHHLGCWLPPAPPTRPAHLAAKLGVPGSKLSRHDNVIPHIPRHGARRNRSQRPNTERRDQNRRVRTPTAHQPGCRPRTLCTCPGHASSSPLGRSPPRTLLECQQFLARARFAIGDMVAAHSELRTVLMQRQGPHRFLRLSRCRSLDIAV